MSERMELAFYVYKYMCVCVWYGRSISLFTDSIYRIWVEGRMLYAVRRVCACAIHHNREKHKANNNFWIDLLVNGLF